MGRAPRPAGRRSVILLSCDEAYEARRLVTVAPVTTRARRIPVEAPLGPKDGMPRECVANSPLALRDRLAAVRWLKAMAGSTGQVWQLWLRASAGRLQSPSAGSSGLGHRS